MSAAVESGLLNSTLQKIVQIKWNYSNSVLTRISVFPVNFSERPNYIH